MTDTVADMQERNPTEQVTAPNTQPTVQVVSIRDPDGETVMDLFIDGVPVRDFAHYEVDAGRGWDWEDWVASRDEDLEQAGRTSPQLRAAVADAYDDPPGSKYITGRGRQPWLPQSNDEEN